jgi:hypothetical protein
MDMRLPRDDYRSEIQEKDAVSCCASYRSESPGQVAACSAINRPTYHFTQKLLRNS